MAAEITLALSMPWAIRPPKGVVRANSSFRCTALLSPETPANNTMSASVMVRENVALKPGRRSSTSCPLSSFILSP